MNRSASARNQLVAGGVAGMVEVALTHPLDLAKNRMMFHFPQGAAALAPSARPPAYRSALSVLVSTLRSESVRGLYKGVSLPLLATFPQKGLKFVVYGATVPVLGPGLAGALGGAAEAALVTPMDVVKLALEASRAPASEASRAARRTVRSLLAAPLSRWTRGFPPTAARYAVFGAVWFPVFDAGSASLGLPVPVAGAVAGVAGVTVVAPLDRFKTLVQSQAYAGSSVRDLAAALVKAPVSELYKGFGPAAARCGIGAAIIFTVHSAVLGVLERSTPPADE